MDWTSAYRPERRASIEDISQAIHDSVTMDEAVAVYAPSPPPRHHRIPCPIHNGKDYNLSYTPHGFKCFVCGASGDVIGFVKEVCELATRSDAMRRINADFNLNLPIDGTLSAIQSATLALKREEAKKRQAELKAWEAKYNALMDEWVSLDKKTREVTDPFEQAEIRERMRKLEYELDSMPEKPKG